MIKSLFWRCASRIVRFLQIPRNVVCKEVVFKGFPIISMKHESSIAIGERSVLVSSSRYTALGVATPTIIRTLTPEATIKIGRDVGMSGSIICSAISVSVGDRCLLGSGVKIFDTDFHPVLPENRRYTTDASAISSAPVEIQNDVFIGTGSIICKGITIGSGSVIAAGSIVVKNVPPRSIVGGNPASLIRSID